MDETRGPAATTAGVNVRLLVAEFVAMLVVTAAILFVAAGTIAWPAGWAFLGVTFVPSAVGYWWLVRRDPGLVAERMTGLDKSDHSRWDRSFVLVACVLMIGWLVVMPLDAVRFRWSHVPAPVQVAGAVLLLGSFWLHFLVFRENSYLSPALRVQSERGQTLVDTGPYRYVRHPMYTSLVGVMASASLMLGSWFGLLGCLAVAVAVAVRAMGEEGMLMRQLPGYDAYMTRVKYRLVPFVW
jgi:protein-S-isoprenylcysteine O-methyltransferase Ste14